MKFNYLLLIFVISCFGLIFLMTHAKAQIALCPKTPQASCNWCAMVYNCPSSTACGNDCYYGLLGCNLFHCTYCYKDSNKNKAPYLESDTCRFADPYCLTTGWVYNGMCSICGDGKKSMDCTSGGCPLGTQKCRKGHCGASCSYPTNDCDYKPSYTSTCNSDCTCAYSGVTTKPCACWGPCPPGKTLQCNPVNSQCCIGPSTTTTTTIRPALLPTTTTIRPALLPTTTTIRPLGGGGGGGGRAIPMSIMSDSTFLVIDGVIVVIILVAIFGALQFFAKSNKK